MGSLAEEREKVLNLSDQISQLHNVMGGSPDKQVKVLMEQLAILNQRLESEELELASVADQMVKVKLHDQQLQTAIESEKSRGHLKDKTIQDHDKKHKETLDKVKAGLQQRLADAEGRCTQLVMQLDKATLDAKTALEAQQRQYNAKCKQLEDVTDRLKKLKAHRGAEGLISGRPPP